METKDFNAGKPHFERSEGGLQDASRVRYFEPCIAQVEIAGVVQIRAREGQQNLG